MLLREKMREGNKIKNFHFFPDKKGKLKAEITTEILPFSQKGVNNFLDSSGLVKMKVC